ncbi:4-(cytidine 5'-diphospho)-2-C-methyl-D-erythritol kinase [Kingella denitrificans]
MLPEHHPRYPSPAKLNLDLRITGRLPNGYHALESIFTLIDLQDTLCIVSRGDGQIVLHTPTPNVPDEQNLVVRAAKSLRDKAATPGHGADIWLEKRIPMGGGLGGGSSNAATVLMVLNDLWQCGLNTAQLLELALPLGADVPFFIFGRTAFARGVGEQLQPIDVPQQYYVLVRPDVHVSTPAVFAHPDLPRNSIGHPHPTYQNLQPLRNDMQAVVLQDYPEVQAAFAELQKYGTARMTGSGSCLFLTCEQPQQAQHIRQQLSDRWQSWCVRSLPMHPLFGMISNR